jgi:cytochrome P450
VAGLSNTGINAAWVLIYLAHSTNWQEKVRAEIISTVRDHSKNPELPLVEQLTSLPIEIWESGFPMIDLCLRESIRLQSNNVAMRQNISGQDIQLANVIIPHGAFVGYHKADIHKDVDIYPSPEMWNPGRFLSEKITEERPYTYIGWGVARHPCCEFFLQWYPLLIYSLPSLTYFLRSGNSDGQAASYNRYNNLVSHV